MSGRSKPLPYHGGIGFFIWMKRKSNIKGAGEHSDAARSLARSATSKARPYI